MALQIDQKLVSDLEKYGAEHVSKCFQCGNCTSVCHLSEDDQMFPRKQVRMVQLGMTDKLSSSLEPWLCYYCGECSAECPRGAEPGETMMALRRWLTAKYDFTGIAGLFYKSGAAEIAAIVALALLTGLGFYWYGSAHGDINVYDGPNAFLSSHAIHRFDWAMASLLVVLLGTNCIRMWWMTTGAKVKIPLSIYLKKAVVLPVHFFTQPRYKSCEKKQPWAVHLVLMLSYVTMLVLIMFFLQYVQAGPAINWGVHVFGYVASIGLMGAVIFSIRARFAKSMPLSRNTHESDWIFLAMLFLVTATGIMQHLLHRSGALVEANVMYLVHLAFVVPMLVLEVPFSKWSHMAYRPLAVYFSEVQREAALSRLPGTAAEPSRGAPA